MSAGVPFAFDGAQRLWRIVGTRVEVARDGKRVLDGDGRALRESGHHRMRRVAEQCYAAL